MKINKILKFTESPFEKLQPKINDKYNFGLRQYIRYAKFELILNYNNQFSLCKKYKMLFY